MIEKKIILRQVFLDKIMRLDSNLHKILIDSLIDSIQFYNNPCYTGYWNKSRYKECPVTMDTVKYMSEYLRAVYVRDRQSTIDQFKLQNILFEDEEHRKLS